MAFVRRVGGKVVDVAAKKQRDKSSFDPKAERSEHVRGKHQPVTDDQGKPLFAIVDSEWTEEPGTVDELWNQYFPDKKL